MLYKLYWFIQTIFLRLVINKIGLSSYVANPIFLHRGRGIYIGNRVRVFPGARMETYNNGKIIIEDNIALQQNVHITCSTEELRIGKNTTILGNVFLSNIDHDYTEIGVHILDQKYIVRTTNIGENCFIGFGAAIQAGTILGKQCVVGANSVVRGTFPDYCVIVGAPARIVKRYNSETKAWQKTDAKGNFI